MPAPTVYRSTDIAAPVWSGTSSAQDRAKYLMTVLKACLVDGYAGKPAAGWALVGHDTVMPQLSIKNGSETGALRLTFQSSSLYLSVYQSMSAIDAGVGGVSLDSVVAPSGLSAVGGPPEFSVAGGLRWCLVADPRSFVMFWWAVTDWSYFTIIGGGGRNGCLFAGQAGMTTGAALEGAVPGNFIGGPLATSTSYHWSLTGSVPSVSIAALPDGSAAAKSGQFLTTGSFLQDYGAEYLIPAVFGQAAPAPGSTLSSSTRRAVGHVRGLYYSVMGGAEYWKKRFTSDLTPGNAITIAGKSMLPVTAASPDSARMAFVSLDPADWP